MGRRQRWTAGRRGWAQRELRSCPGRPVPRPTGNRASAQRPPARRGRHGFGRQAMTGPRVADSLLPHVEYGDRLTRVEVTVVLPWGVVAEGWTAGWQLP